MGLPQSISGDGRTFCSQLNNILHNTKKEIAETKALIPETNPNAPNSPTDLNVQFDKNGVLWYWNFEANTNLDFFELRTDANPGNEINLVDRTRELKSTLVPSLRSGTMYLYARGINGMYSTPCTLQYNKAVPTMPTGLVISELFQGINVKVDSIPDNCIGMTVRVNGEDFFSANSSFDYNATMGTFIFKVAYRDAFGNGVFSIDVSKTIYEVVPPNLTHISGLTVFDDGIIVARMLGDQQVVGTKIKDDTITSGKIGANQIVTGHMNANSIKGDRIEAGTLDATKITAETITSAQIEAGSIVTDRMTANSINGDRITAGTLHASKIQAGTISANEIGANQIKTGHMGANTISGDRIAAGTLNADRIVAGSIDATKIAQGSIPLDKLLKEAWTPCYRQYIIQNFDNNNWVNNPASFDKSYCNSIPSLGGVFFSYGNASFAVPAVLFEMYVYCPSPMSVVQLVRGVDDALYVYVNGGNTYQLGGGNQTSYIQHNFGAGRNTLQFVLNNNQWGTCALVLLGDIINGSSIKFDG